MEMQVKTYIEYDIEKRAPWDSYKMCALKEGDITEEMLDDIAFKVERLINDGRLSFGRGERFQITSGTHYVYDVTAYLRCKIVLNEE